MSACELLTTVIGVPGAINVKKVTKVITGVLVSRFNDLTSLPKEAVPNLGNNLYTHHLINGAVKDNPSMEKYITEFEAILTFKRKLPQVQELCQKFLNSFIAVGGSYAAAALSLHEDWIKAVRTEVGLDFNIDMDS